MSKEIKNKNYKREKRQNLNKKKNTNEPIVIEFNLSKAVALITAIVIIVGAITTTKIITTLIEGKEENSLTTTEGQNSDRVTWVTSSDGQQVPVPKGYSASQIPGETSANGGFVIYEGDIDWSTILVGDASTASIEEDTNKDNPTIENDDEATNTNTEATVNEEEPIINNEEEEKTNVEETPNTEIIDGIEEIDRTQNTEQTSTTKEDENTEQTNKIEEPQENDQENKTEQTNITESTNGEESTGTNSNAENLEKTENKTGTEENAKTETENSNTETTIEEDLKGNIQNTNKTAGTTETQSAVKENDLSIEDNNEENIANSNGEDTKENNNEGIALLAEDGTPTQEEINIFQLQKTTNQWVWVPVDEEELKNIYGVDSSGKLWGKLWDFPLTNTTTGTRTPYNSSWTETDGIMSIASKTTYREPDVTHYNTNYDIDSRLQNYIYGQTQYELLSEELENHFYETIESIKKYGGFYIGRYETGGLNGIAVVRKMDTNIASQTWYTMYKKCKTLSGENSNVVTSMIWGSLWDETLEWLVKSGATNSAGTAITYKLIRNNSTTWGNYYNSTFNYIPADSETGEATETKAASTSTPLPTGCSEYTKVNNIYDMAGNRWDWTLEANSTFSRVYRGGYYNGNGSYYPAFYRNNNFPHDINSYIRLSCPTFN